jgi:hypothetical protein
VTVSKSYGLSTGGKIGISVGVSIAFIVIVVLSVLLYRALRKKRYDVGVEPNGEHVQGLGQVPASLKTHLSISKSVRPPTANSRDYYPPDSRPTERWINQVPVEVPAEPLSPEEQEILNKRAALRQLQERHRSLSEMQKLEQQQIRRMQELDQVNADITKQQAELDELIAQRK